MPVAQTVFEIEREARWRVWSMFALLLGFVYLVTYGAVLVAHGLVSASISDGESLGKGSLAWVLTPPGAALMLACALVISALYWFVSRVGAKERLIHAMSARPLDPGDRYHRRLANIVEELRLATGDRRIECVVVPTVGMNAFAFSDMKSTHVIGVTEGALSRLSRQQLQAVVAHEFAHILSGDCATATISCLLFGIYSTLSDSMMEIMSAGEKARSGFVMVGAGTLWALLGLLRMASLFTNAAISRSREMAADLAAARFTRDPLSLAQALHMMRRHPGGSGYIPSGLSPLCIRPTLEGSGAMLIPGLATHPPIDARIVRLLAVAHVGPDEFEKRAAEAEEYFDGREHVEGAPGPSGLGHAADAAVIAASTDPVAAVANVAADAATAALLGRNPGNAAPASAAVATGWVPRTGPVAAASAPSLGCPSCDDRLRDLDYEGVTVAACPSCAGRLVGMSQVQRIITRRQTRFTEEQERIADLVDEQGDVLRRQAILARRVPQSRRVACPRCGRVMMCGHYSYQYAVEVDRCLVCDVIWFETNELEVLQVLVERQTG